MDFNEMAAEETFNVSLQLEIPELAVTTELLAMTIAENIEFGKTLDRDSQEFADQFQVVGILQTVHAKMVRVAQQEGLIDED